MWLNPLSFPQSYMKMSPFSAAVWAAPSAEPETCAPLDSVSTLYTIVSYVCPIIRHNSL
jgi:hypothetical protein